MSDLTAKEKVEFVLENYPESREDTNYLIIRVWQHFEGFPTGSWVEKMIAELSQVETIRRQARKIQNDDGKWQPRFNRKPKSRPR